MFQNNQSIDSNLIPGIYDHTFGTAYQGKIVKIDPVLDSTFVGINI